MCHFSIRRKATIVDILFVDGLVLWVLLPSVLTNGTWSGSFSWVHTCAVLRCFSCVWFFATPCTVAHQAPLSMEISKQKYWSGLPCLPPGDLPHLRVKPMSLVSPALASRFFNTRTMWEARVHTHLAVKFSHWPILIFWKHCIFIYLFLAIWVFVAGQELSLDEPRSWGAQASVALAHRFHCSSTHGIFLDWGSNQGSLGWQVDS